jgi:hypothetical protein
MKITVGNKTIDIKKNPVLANKIKDVLVEAAKKPKSNLGKPESFKFSEYEPKETKIKKSNILSPSEYDKVNKAYDDSEAEDPKLAKQLSNHHKEMARHHEKQAKHTYGVYHSALAELHRNLADEIQNDNDELH